MAAPQLRCLSVNAAGDVTLTWIIPPDPSALFTKYEIWHSQTPFGFAPVGTVNIYGQTSFTHVSGGLGNNQSQYYYVKTISSAGTATSTPSDTLRSIFLNLSAPFLSIGVCNWNALKIPPLPSTSTTFTVSRQEAPGPWTTIYTGNKFNYNDTITQCSVNYNYKIENSDASGCVSNSNISGHYFEDGYGPHIVIMDSASVNAAGQTVFGWEPSSSGDAIGYIINEVVNNVLVPIDTVYGINNTSFTFTGTSNSDIYTIVAMDSCGKVSVPSINQTKMVSNSSYDLCSRTANLTWTAYVNLPEGVLHYKIYYAVNGGTLTLLDSTTNTSYAHTNLNPNDTYCYTIRVVNSDRSITASANPTCVLAKAPQGPGYVYIRSVSVNAGKQVVITYAVDNTKPFKGATIFKSEDGVNFNAISFNASTASSLQVYVDGDVNTTDKNYYYRVQITDSCGNPGSFSNTSKTILLHVSHDNDNLFYNTLTWDDYTSWSGNVASYNIYRAINGAFNPVPISNVSFMTKTYTDDVQDFVSDQGKFSYYVEAVEGAGNIYGFNDVASSNPADAYVEVNVFVPNAFAPKGINTVWLPVAQFVEKTDYKVMVFDRWGTKIFETHSDTEGWTGNGATDDVYVYIIEYKNARGEYIQLKGHLNIVR